MLLRSADVFNDVLGLKNLVDTYFEKRDYGRAGKSPLVNLYENETRVIIDILVPGTAVEDINLEFKDHNLMVTATRKNENTGATYIRRERSSGTFSKSIKIPFRINPDSIDAKLNDGVLTVTLDKSEEAKPRTIQIR
jgi:HSP20 family protein